MTLFKVKYDYPKRVFYVRAAHAAAAWDAARHFECLMDRDHGRTIQEAVIEELTKDEE